ncbi:hypothetical protein D3C87_1771260 [compost metagenome]
MVMKGVEKSFFAGQAFKKVQVRVARLYAIFTRQVLVRNRLLVVEDAVLFQHELQNLGHGQQLKDAPIGTQACAGQPRFNGGPIARATKACRALLEAGHHAVHIAHRGVVAPDG